VQVPTRATTEIRSVADALDRLQGAAYQLATEQALQRRRTIESLANLGRRNQNLIRRQLGFITALEHEEIDPSALANLFELDHLATRMRRNAASLLVLVGASSPRQWPTAIPIADVIRAAVSEVEEYRRVVLRRVDDALVLGTGVGSIAHLMSELIENGLTFSPPDSEVEVQGRRLVDSYLIAVTDQGVGMSSEDLQRANGRLRGEEDFIAAPTRFLGHFVVGRLARETGIQVELLPSPVTGVTARVTLPATLLSSSLSVESARGARQGSPEVSVQLTSVPMPHTGPVTGPMTRPVTGPVTGPVVLPPTGPQPALPSLPASVSSMLGQHPLVHPFAGDLTVTAPNQGAPAQAPITGPGPVAGSVTGAVPLPPTPAQGMPGEGGRPTAAGGTLLVGGGADDHAARTPNGLRKRMPRDQRAPAMASAQPIRRVIDLTAADRPAVDDSPAEVRARLTALRAGIQRGQGAGTVTPVRAASSDHVVEDPE
jgi:hypothetical protein